MVVQRLCACGFGGAGFDAFSFGVDPKKNANSAERNGKNNDQEAHSQRQKGRRQSSEKKNQSQALPYRHSLFANERSAKDLAIERQTDNVENLPAIPEVPAAGLIFFQ